MRVLVFGGTRFLGRAVVECALGRGHTITVFHRGLSNPDLFPDATHVIGDRETDLARLAKKQTFDAVVDTCAFEVPTVRKAARAIEAPYWVFVSSISVYAELARMDEDGPARTTDDAEHATLSLDRYGALKAACERAYEEELPGKVLSVRAGKIDGPHDVDERFHHWLTRIARGGEALAPGDPNALVQDIDVRDLAEWIVRCVENRTTGVMNATGDPMSMQTFLETIRRVVGSDARFTWVPDEVLVKDDVKPYSEMPYWIPGKPPPVPIDRAKRAGLTMRPFEETVRDTWAWIQRSWSDEARIRALRRLKVPAGIDEARERRLLLESR